MHVLMYMQKKKKIQGYNPDPKHKHGLPSVKGRMWEE